MATESSDPAPTTGASEASSSVPISNGSHTEQGSSKPLAADEIALYDRQIRLWGAEAQRRIRSANVLLISLRALGTEIAKNLTLVGISSLTIIDEEPVSEEDLGSQYFLREDDIGKPRAQAALPRIQELNPRVAVKLGGSLQDLLAQDQNFYTPYNCIVACDHNFMTLSMINTAVRVANRPFYAAGIHGFYGFIFADLNVHEYIVERETSNLPTAIGPETATRSVVSVTSKKGNDGKAMEIVKKHESYCPLLLANSSPLPTDVMNNRRKLKGVTPLLPCLRALFDFERSYGRYPGHSEQDIREFAKITTTKVSELQLPNTTINGDILRSFLHSIGTEIVPTAAFVGGRVSEDVINVLGKREQPIQNFAFFDGDSLEGKIYSLYSPPPELALDEGMNGLFPMSSGMMGGVTDANLMMPIPFNSGLPMDMQMSMPMGIPMMDSSMAMVNGGAMMGMMNGAGAGAMGMMNGAALPMHQMNGSAPTNPGEGQVDVAASTSDVQPPPVSEATQPTDPAQTIPADGADQSSTTEGQQDATTA